MSATDVMERATGSWTGTNHLSLGAGGPVSVSETTATVVRAAGDFYTIAYTWSFNDEPQRGLLIVGPGGDRGDVGAVWVDSWHMSREFMICRGSEAAGVISLRGSYAAPPGPDWGWHTKIGLGPDEAFKMVMYNVSPAGEESLAVEAVYRR